MLFLWILMLIHITAVSYGLDHTTRGPCQKNVIQNILEAISGAPSGVHRFGKGLALSQDDLKLWREAFNQEELLVPTTLSNFPEDYFFHFYAKLPKSIQLQLEGLSGTAEEIGKSLQAVERHLKILDSTFLSDLARTDRISGLQEKSFSDFLKQGRENYQHLAEARKSQIATDFAYRQLARRAYLKWRSSNYLSVRVPVEPISKGEVMMRLGENHYQGRIKGRNLILTVPTAQVRTPAWNPLDHSKVAKMSQNLNAVPFPGAYPVHLGLDGLFYLQDGNHRFAITSTFKKKIKISLPYPSQTVPLSAFLDDLNVRQPSDAVLIDIMDGKIDPLEVLPPLIRKRVIWNSLDLQRGN